MKRNYLELFSRINREITSTLESRQMIARCLKALIDGLDCEAASIFLVNPETGQTELFALSNEQGGLQKIVLNRAEGVVGWVIDNNEAVHVPDAATDNRFTTRVDSMSEFKTKAILAAPMVRQGRVAGVLEALNPNAGNDFTSEDLDFCRLIAGQLAIVVRNIDLFTQTQSLLEEIQELDRMKSAFITMASHELFTPLTKIKMQSQLLADGLLGELADKQQEGITRILSSVDQLTHIARDLTNMNLLEKGGIQIELFDDHLNAVLLNTIEETRPLCEKRHLHFVTHLDPGLPQMRLDRRLVTILVRNILMNAIRFTPDDGTVTLITSQAGPDIEIRIVDTGIGVDKKDFKHIFKPLHEGSDTTYHHSGTIEFMSGGLGLGLPIARSIAQAHNGGVWVESEGRDKGSTFVIRLPLDPLEVT